MYIYIDIVKEFSCEMCGQCCFNDWLVTMDEESYQRNKRLFMEKGKKEEFSNAFIPIKGKCELGEYAYIAKKASGGCWFLGENNLCRLQAETDHNHLDAVCQTFPRYPMNTSRGMELTLSFSCPTVIRIASRSQPLEIIRSAEAPMKIKPNNEVVHVYPEQQSAYNPLRYYFQIEHHMMDILQSRIMTVGERIELIKGTIQKISSLQGDTISQKLNEIVHENYEYIDAMGDIIEPANSCSPEILIENFFVNFVFKKPFYIYGLERGMQLLETLWLHIEDARKGNGGDLVADMGCAQRTIMELEFQYSHNRRAFLMK
jgi:lysine-N-methylase